jgi:hypothetical protein
LDTQRLYKSLPQVSAWIAATLESHRDRTRIVGSLGLPRLASYYSPQLLASVRVVAVKEIPVPPLTALGLPELADFEGMGADAITFLDTIFVRTSHARDESLYFHELVHAAQWHYMGADKFLLVYGIGLLEAGYHGNPVEIMAYDLQSEFDRGKPPFDVPAEVARRLDRIVPSMMERAA